MEMRPVHKRPLTAPEVRVERVRYALPHEDALEELNKAALGGGFVEVGKPIVPTFLSGKVVGGVTALPCEGHGASALHLRKNGL